MSYRPTMSKINCVSSEKARETCGFANVCGGVLDGYETRTTGEKQHDENIHDSNF